MTIIPDDVSLVHATTYSDSVTSNHQRKYRHIAPILRLVSTFEDDSLCRLRKYTHVEPVENI